MITQVQAIENLNFWNDPRVLASLKTSAYKVLSSSNKMTRVQLTDSLLESLVIDENLPQDHDGIFELATQHEVCGLCSGSGSVVNPNIDCGGVSFDSYDRDYDPDFEENYKNGVYNQTCPTCGGLRVVPRVEFTGDLKMAIEEFVKEEERYARLVASERAYGC